MSYSLGKLRLVEWRLGDNGSYATLPTARDLEIIFDRDFLYTPPAGQVPASFEIQGTEVLGVLILADEAQITPLMIATPCGINSLTDPNDFIWLRATREVNGQTNHLRTTYSPVAFGGRALKIRTAGRTGGDARPESGAPAWILVPFQILMDPCAELDAHIMREFVDDNGNVIPPGP